MEGATRAEAAAAGGMDRQTLRDWVHRYNAAGMGGLVDHPRRGRPGSLSTAQMQELKELVLAGPVPERDGVVRWRCSDLREQIVQHRVRDPWFLASGHGGSPSIPSCPTAHEIPDSPEKLSFKKRFSPANRTGPTSRGAARNGGGISAGLTRRAWSSSMVELRRKSTGPRPRLVDGPINGERFRVYVEQVLAPTLLAGDVVIMDNLGSHKGHAVRQAIRQTGARLFLLPKYSPDLNPIEQVFAKLKHLLRKAAARTRDTVCAAIAQLLAAYTPDECANYLRNSGYGST